MRDDRLAPLVLSLAAVAALAADQVTKELVRHYIKPGQAIPEHGAFRLINVTNEGIIFGLGAPRWFAIALPAVLVLAVLGAICWYRPRAGNALTISIGLFVGGTLGNWVDRLRFPGVTDFIDVRLKEDLHWFTFNLADVFILAAIVLFVIAIFGRRPGRAAGDRAQTPPGDSPLSG